MEFITLFIIIITVYLLYYFIYLNFSNIDYLCYDYWNT